MAMRTAVSIPRKTVIPSTSRGISKDVKHHRDFFDGLGKQLGIKKLDDWYNVLNRKLIVDYNGGALLVNHRNSSVVALVSAYPEHKWLPWKFSEPSRYSWNPDNQRQFMDWLGKELGIKTLDDWYQQASVATFLKHGGRTLLLAYHRSVYTLLSSVYPEHNWIPWKFKNIPKHYWSDPDNCKKFLDWLGKELNLKDMDDWYNITGKVIIEHGGFSLLKQFNFSVAQLLASTYPQLNWVPWKFHNVENGFWDYISNHKLFFDWLGTQVGVQQLDDWYNILTHQLVTKYGGRGLLSKYRDSPSLAVVTLYPHHKWQEWRFLKVPTGFWQCHANRLKYMEWLAQHLGINHLEDWYPFLTCKTFMDHGGSSLLVMYRRSPLALIRGVYPDHPWNPWKLPSVPSSFLSPDSLRGLLQEIADKLHITQLDDWYRVSAKQLLTVKALHVIKKYGGLYKVLKRVYPDHKWNQMEFLKSFKRAAQRWLYVTLQSLFPGHELLEDYQNPKILYESSKRSMQLDVFIPSLSLGFEYQGEQHFQDIHVFEPSERYQERDSEKKAACAAHNITLVAVPFWWDRTPSTLVGTILKVRPDLKETLGVEGPAPESILEILPSRPVRRKQK